MASLIAAKYGAWKAECNERFARLKANEEELNRIFIALYGLTDELRPEVASKDVTVTVVYDTQDEVPEELANSRYVKTREDVIKSLLSYAVGCMFGRYSLDYEGLAYAGGEWDASKYVTFQPDRDNIIPICEEEYFTDDIVTRLVEFVRVVYGEETLEENLRYIAMALGDSRGTARSTLRQYFLKDFYTDHCRVYQKRPIYWLCDSGRKNAFKALIYLHRYQRDTLARLRTDYIHELQGRLHTARLNLTQQAGHTRGTEHMKAQRELTKLREQAEELRLYEEKVHHLADEMIELNLDAGVKVNYARLQEILAKIR